MQQGSSESATGTLTDEQILGLDDGLQTGGANGGSPAGETAGRAGGAGAATGQDVHGDLPFDDWGVAEGNGARVAERLAQIDRTESGAAASDARVSDAAAGRVGEAEPAWLAALETQPAAAAEARRWRDAAKDVSALDAAYFSSEPGARSGLAERLYQSDPAAFRAMLADSTRMLAARDPHGLAELARQLGMPEAAAPLRPRSLSQAAQAETGADGRNANGAANHLANTADNATANAVPSGATNTTAGHSPNAATNTGAAFPAEAYRAFESSTNEDVGRRMREAIDRTLTSTLPEGIAAGARRRIGEDVFREVHASLSSDRELSRRVGETLRDWRFDAAARQQVVAMVSGRARAVLPEVARRVVAEWTSSVLASDRAKMARIDSATARRDITGGRLPEPVASGAMRPRDVDYRRLSDEQILEM
jgi:hypothetical protein